MIKSYIAATFFWVLTSIMLFGCSGMPVMKAKTPLATREELTLRYTEKAVAAQQQENLTAAMLNWTLVQALNPEDAAVTGKIEVLEKRIRQKAQAHFDRGRRYYQKGRMANARTEFLKVLHLSPNHTKARDFLKNKLRKKSASMYRVKKGDRLKDIANKFYNDPGKDVLIAHLNDLKANAVPKPGTLLVLPMMRAPVPEAEVLIEETEIAAATRLFKEKKYRNAIKTADKILAASPGDKQALSIKSSSLLALANSSFERGDPVTALELLKQADRDAPDIRDTINRIRAETGKQAEDYYQHGVALYLKEDLAGAIQQWKYALSLDPDHIPTQKGIRDVNHLIEDMTANINDIPPPLAPYSPEPDQNEAEKTIPPSTGDTDITTQIEHHYRKGISYYINEDVKNAVREWKIVLSLDPDHKNAREYIENARQLQQHIDAME